MKIAYGSDIHLDVDALHIQISEMPDAEILILAGDVIEINTLKKAVREKHPTKKQSLLLKFFNEISEKYKTVLWIMGNHEYWRGSFNHTHTNASDCMCKLGIANIYVLDNSPKEIDGILFFGTTLWTSCQNQNPLTMFQVARMMNDYSKISVKLSAKKNRKFTTEDSVHANGIAIKNIQYLQKIHAQKKVLITHHSMSFKSISNNRCGDVLNYAYANDLDGMIMDYDMLAIHGHIHEDQDYMVGKCRVLAAPRGYYGYESSASDYKFKTIEI